MLASQLAGALLRRAGAPPNAMPASTATLAKARRRTKAIRTDEAMVITLV